MSDDTTGFTNWSPDLGGDGPGGEPGLIGPEDDADETLTSDGGGGTTTVDGEDTMFEGGSDTTAEDDGTTGFEGYTPDMGGDGPGGTQTGPVAADGGDPNPDETMDSGGADGMMDVDQSTLALAAAGVGAVMLLSRDG